MLTLTKHAQTRLAQRGFRSQALSIMMLFGSETADGYMMARQDAERAIAGLRRLIAHVERLNGARIVTQGGAVVTAYYPGRRHSKRLLRARRHLGVDDF